MAETAAEAAQLALAEFGQVRDRLISQLNVPPGTPDRERADYWLGFLEGTIMSLIISASQPATVTGTSRPEEP